MPPDLWKTLDLIQNELGLDENRLASLMGCTPERLRELKDAKKPPSVIGLVVLSTNLDIPFTPLASGKLTLEDLERAKKKIACS